MGSVFANILLFIHVGVMGIDRKEVEGINVRQLVLKKKKMDLLNLLRK